MTVNTRIISLVLSSTETNYVQISHGHRIQIVPDFDALPYCQRYQSAAFVRSHRLLVVWDDDPTKIIERAQRFQESLVEVIWSATKTNEKGVTVGVHSLSDVMGDITDKPRRVTLWQTLYTTVAIMLLIVCIGSGYKKVGIEIVHDRNWLRMLFLLAFPASAWLGLVWISPNVDLDHLLKHVVLLPSHRRNHRAVLQPQHRGQRQQQVLLCNSPTTAQPRFPPEPTPCHDTNACIRRELGHCYQAHHSVCQASHLHV